MSDPLIKLDNNMTNLSNIRVHLENDRIEFRFLTASTYPTYQFKNSDEAKTAFELISEKLETALNNECKFVDLTKDKLVLDNNIANTLNRVRQP